MNHNRSGITLIELLVYIGISTILLLSVGAFAYSLIKTHSQTNIRFDEQREAHLLMERITAIIEHGYAIDSSSVLDKDFVSDPSAVLIIRTQVAGQDPTRIFVEKGVFTVAYGSAPAIALHSGQFAVQRCSFNNFSTVDQKSRNLSVFFELGTSNAPFGMTTLRFPLTSSVELKDYAP